MNSEQRNHSDWPTGINVDDQQQQRRKFDLKEKSEISNWWALDDVHEGKFRNEDMKSAYR